MQVVSGSREQGDTGEGSERRFFRADSTPVSLSAIVAILQSVVGEEPERRYRLIIGTDSLPGRLRNVHFITAIVLHRVGAGGRYFWCRTHNGPIVTLRDRMFQEALLSLQVAQELSDAPSFQTLALFAELEIHVDIGQRGPTREMIQEIVGMVTAHGYPVRIKPDAFAASKVADRHTVVCLD